MKICVRCKRTKIDTYFFSQFHSEFMGLYIAVSNVCKKCANKLKNKAVNEYEESLSPTLKR